jgi:hypothetical protein
MTKEDCEEQRITYDPSVHLLKDEDIEEELLTVIAENVFRKA